jgi:oxygen-dependent protoporphyrinogen oxidase
VKRIIIIGGGITGLAAAHRLLERGSELSLPLEIVLLEASSRLGGTIQTDFRDGFLLERGPDSFLSEKPEAIQLARRLGVDAQLIGTNDFHRRSFLVRKGRLRTVPEGFQLLAPAKLFPFFSSRIFSLAGKARIAADLVLPRKRLNGDTDESLAHFVRRRFGREALSRMAQPMVGGIYTADPEKLSLRATFPRFLDIEVQHRSIILGLIKAGRTAGVSGARYSLFLSFARGMQVLVNELAQRISSFASGNPDFWPKMSVRLNTTAGSLQCKKATKDPPWRVGLNSGQTVTADAICLALPAHVAARLVSEVAPGLAKQLRAIAHASTATINLAYRREDIPHPLNGFGFVVPFIENRSLLACTFSSVKFPGRAPAGRALLRAFVGGALQPEIFDLDEAEMISRVRRDLRDLIGIEEPPLFAEVSKWPRSMPQYEVGHLRRIQEIKKELQSVPTLKLSGNAYAGAGIPDCIRSGENAADELIESLSPREANRVKGRL